MKNIFRVIDDLRWKHYRQFNNIVISESLATEITKFPMMISSPVQSNKLPKYIDGYIYGIEVIVDKYMPKNRLVLRNNYDIVEVVNIE